MKKLSSIDTIKINPDREKLETFVRERGHALLEKN
jgi:hypothetical protein